MCSVVCILNKMKFINSYASSLDIALVYDEDERWGCKIADFLLTHVMHNVTCVKNSDFFFEIFV